jgi:acetylornithine deacetylase/succinyl-diaminopimelate desuccinylase family protein
MTSVTGVGAGIDTFLDRNRAELLDLLADLVRIDSQIPPYSDERQIVAFLRGRLAELDLGESEILESDPHRPNLITRIAGAGGGRSLALNGHLDTKPVGDSRSLWQSDPFVPEVRDDCLYGLGASDMKAAVAAMVFAALAVRDAAPPLAGDLVLAFVADEEAGSTLGARFVAPRLRGVDACLIGEPSGWEHDWQGLHLASRGVCGFRIRVNGTQMHSSLSDRLPSVNASVLMAALMQSLADDLDLEFVPHPLDGSEPTLNVGVLVSGGVYFGVVPGQAEFACDLRTLPGMTQASVERSLRRWLTRQRQRIRSLDAELRFEPQLGWVPPAEIDREHPLVAVVQDAADEVLGTPPPLSVFPGGTDAPWFESAGIPTIPSFGPGILTCAHGPNESVSLESVAQAARIYARVAAAFCGPADDTGDESRAEMATTVERPRDG